MNNNGSKEYEMQEVDDVGRKTLKLDETYSSVSEKLSFVSDGGGLYSSQNKLKCALMNARSIVNKVPELEAYVYETSPDIILITEAWTRDGVSNAEISLKGYNVIRKDRKDRIGGGCLLFTKEHLNVMVMEDIIGIPLGEGSGNPLP